MNIFFFFIQIIVESLPISSSGHILLAQQLGLIDIADSSINYNFIAHIPMLFIICIYFYNSWIALLLQQKTCESWLKMIRFFIIVDGLTIIAWLLGYFNNACLQIYFLPIGFFITGCCLYATRFFNASKKITWNMRDAMWLGIVQALSLLPGVSRFASTLCTGLALGYSRKDAFLLSFMIQAPLLCAVTIKSLLMSSYAFDWLSYSVFFILLSMSLLSFILFYYVGFLIARNCLWYFALYMLIPVSISVWLMKGCS